MYAFAMMKKLSTASEAYEAAVLSEGILNHINSPFVCPYPNCGVYSEHYWGYMSDVGRRVGATFYPARQLQGSAIFVACCQSCNRDVIFIDGKLVKPATSEAPPPGDDMPVEILPDYSEAAAILPESPRGSAALLRLAVQKLLPLIGATKLNINDQIGELVAQGLISARVQTSLDALRVIGNEAVHPGTIDLKDDVETAMGLFRLLNFIVEKTISDPRHADEMFSMLPKGKQDAIARRDAVTTSNGTNTTPK